MNLTFHILKKDIYRLRVFLVFWLLTVVLTTGANCIQASAENIVVEAILVFSAILVHVCQFIMMALIVPVLIHSEPLTGTTAFWLTRPMKRSEVLTSKLLFCGIFFVLLPVVTNSVLLAASKVPFAYIAADFPETLLYTAGNLLLLLTLSTLTRSFGRFALAGAIYLILVIILGIFVSIFQMYIFSESVSTPVALADSRTLLSEMAKILFLSGVIAFQYRTRRTGWAIALLALGFILINGIALCSPWVVFRMPAKSLMEKDAAGISLVVNKGQSALSVVDKFSLRKNLKSKKEIRGALFYGGLPTNSFAFAHKIDATFFADGTSVESLVFPRGSRTLVPNWVLLEEMLSPLTLIKNEQLVSDSFPLLKIPESEYLAVQNKTGVYEATVDFHVFQYRQVASLPLDPGAEYCNKAVRLRIETVLQETQGCSVILREQSARGLFKRDRTPGAGQYVYLILNKKAGEAYLPKQKETHNLFAKSLSISSHQLRFSSIDNGRIVTPINENWLKDAELMVVQVEWLGDVQKQVKDDSFLFGKSSSQKPIPETETSDNKEVLSTLKLSGNATGDVVNVE